VSNAGTKVWLGVVLGIVVLAGSGFYAWRATQPRHYELKRAKIVKLDVAARTGEIEFVHPKSGRTMTVAAHVIPPTCEITIDGQPAALTDVRVGDTVAVGGLIHADYSVDPQWVHVTRGGADTQPTASTTASEPHASQR
jgi:hypothetical protein